MTRKSRVWHRLNRTTGVLGSLCLAYLASGCAVEPPSAPSTEFVLSIPVANDGTRIADIVGDRSDFLQINEATGGMNIRFSREVVHVCSFSFASSSKFTSSSFRWYIHVRSNSNNGAR